MSLRDRVYEVLLAKSYTDRELAQYLEAPQPSVRRARQELVAAGKVHKAPAQRRQGNGEGLTYQTVWSTQPEATPLSRRDMVAEAAARRAKP